MRGDGGGGGLGEGFRESLVEVLGEEVAIVELLVGEGVVVADGAEEVLQRLLETEEDLCGRHVFRWREFLMEGGWGYALLGALRTLFWS